MNSRTVVYLGPDDLADAGSTGIFTGQSGDPWVTVIIGSLGQTVEVHNDPAVGANPLHVAECFERIAADIRLAFSRWVASPESDTWCLVRDVVNKAEAITQANAPREAA